MASPSSSSSSRSGKSNSPRSGGRPSGKSGPAKGGAKGGSRGGSSASSGGRGSARPSSRSASDGSGRSSSAGKPSRNGTGDSRSSSSRSPGGSGSSSRSGTGSRSGSSPRSGAPSRSGSGSNSRSGSPDRTGSGRPSRPSSGSDRPRSGSAPSGRARSGGDDRATRRSTTEDGWAEGPALETPRTWGGVARRGAGAATGRRVVGASRAWRDAVEAATPQRRPDAARRAAPGAIPDEATDAKRRAANDARTPEDEAVITQVRDEATAAVTRGSSRRRDPAPIDLAGEVREQLSRAVGTARTERVERRLAEAAEHFEAERFADAARILKKLVDEAPTVAAVHELYGLTLYRQEKWKPAARELEAFRLLSNSTDQHPVLADCYRAMRQWAQVGELWDELRAASPSADLVTEGRIVMAGSLADRDDLSGAIALLEQGFTFPKRPMPHHLRRAYVLADLYERSGDLPKARTMFGRIENVEPEFADVRRRARALR